MRRVGDVETANRGEGRPEDMSVKRLSIRKLFFFLKTLFK
jgi:hypothetical protein